MRHAAAPCVVSWFGATSGLKRELEEEEGADDLALIRSVISTARKQGWNLLDTLMGNPNTLIGQLRFA